MSTTPDHELLPVPEPTAEPEAKPVRRRRAPAAAAAGAETPATADAPAPTAAGSAADALPKPRRRRATAAAGADVSAAGEPAAPGEPRAPVDMAPPAPPTEVVAAAAATVPPAAEPPCAVASQPVAGPAEPTRAAVGEPDAGEPAGDGAAPEAGADGERGPRSHRRNRRDRRRGERPEGERPDAGVQAEAAGADAESDEAPPRPSLPPVDPGELFAEVLSGAFDQSAEPPAAEPEAPHKRVLAAEPESPKLHKVLAQAGIGSRRDMEAMILEGRITVNGKPAHIGQRISFGDQIKIGGKPVKVRILPPPPRIVAYHKPAGEIVTHDDPQNRPTVFRRLPRLPHGKWQSVGRLDINTEGLLLFTNSGELANQLMHPRFGVEREYAVRVLGALDEDSREELLEGVDIDGQTAAFKSIEDGGGDGANRWYRVVITEGRNREVRKLFDAVGLTVSRLIRIRYGTVVLPRGLKRGMWVDLGEDDVRAIRRLAAPQQQPQQARDDRGPRGDNQPNDKRKRRGNRGPDRPRGPRPPDASPMMERRADEPRFDDHDEEPDDHVGPIPNPLEQTFDKRFVQKPRSPAGGRGFGRGGGGFGPGGSAPPSGGGQKPGKGPRQPDPMQTSMGYIGADAYQRKRGGGGGRGGRGGGFGGGR
jgi:23S rRNA pseudouridine2605 synthase